MKTGRAILLILALLLSCSANALERVIFFSQEYCASCAVTKTYLDTHGVPYSEFMIDKSKAALDYFIKLGGRGTPFIIVDNQKMQGFQKDRFWQIYGERERDD